MPRKQFRFFILLCSLFVLSGAAFAEGGLEPGKVKVYEPIQFQAAQKAGKTILLDFHASWCPTCRTQAPILEKLAMQNPEIVFFRVDYDREKDLRKQFNVRKQSTLVVFRGMNEKSRSLGETNPEKINNLLN